MPGIPTPLANRKPGDIDFVVVRENTEGEYSSVGGRMFEGTEREIVFQESVFSRKGVDRIMKFAFELARTRPREARDVGDQVERHLDHDAVLGRALSRDGARSIRDITHRPVPHRHPVRALRAAAADASTSSSARTCSATSSPTSARRCAARSASRRRRTSIPERDVPVAVRAGARLGAGHRGQGHRQSDRPDLVGRDDARVPRPQRTRRDAIVAAIERVLADPERAAHAGPRRQGDHGGPGKRDRATRYSAHAGRDSCTRALWHDSGNDRTIARGVGRARRSRCIWGYSMLIGIPRETRPGETRVAATPETVKKLAASGKHAIVVEVRRRHRIEHSRRRLRGGRRDDRLAPREALGADLVLKVRAPDRRRAPAAQVAARCSIGLLNPFDPAGVAGAARRGRHRLRARMAAAHLARAVDGRAVVAGEHRRATRR